MTNNLPQLLRARACPAGEPWTGDNPEEDHGHTDCWLMHQAADEIERLSAENDRLRALITAWADAEDSEGGYPVGTARHVTDACIALRKAVGR